jgi:hypothetical protein
MKQQYIGRGLFRLVVQESSDDVDVLIADGVRCIRIAGRRVPSLIKWLVAWQKEQDAKKRKRGG